MTGIIITAIIVAGIVTLYYISCKYGDARKKEISKEREGDK